MITLGDYVEGMIDVLIDLLLIAHLIKETAKDMDATNP